MARLSPISAPPSKKVLGLLMGQLHVPDDFDAPLPDEVIAAFEGRFLPRSLR